MKPSEQDIERLLRGAPRPTPPAGLEDKLSANVVLPGTTARQQNATLLTPTISTGWLRRWWPVLLPATATFVCCVVMAVQQMEIRDLRKIIESSPSETAPTNAAPATTTSSAEDANILANRAAAEREEIEKLKSRLAQLASEIASLEQTQQKADGLRAQSDAPRTLDEDELDALLKAKARAQMIQCVNYLKQFGLAVRMWAIDNNDVFPPDILSMSNEINTPKILVCPADTNRVVATVWGNFSSANVSYEYLTPSATNGDMEPTRVLSRCPIHGTIGLCDGSVHAEAAMKSPEALKQRDGKLYFER